MDSQKRIQRAKNLFIQFFHQNRTEFGRENIFCNFGNFRNFFFSFNFLLCYIGHCSVICGRIWTILLSIFFFKFTLHRIQLSDCEHCNYAKTTRFYGHMRVWGDLDRLFSSHKFSTTEEFDKRKSILANGLLSHPIYVETYND